VSARVAIVTFEELHGYRLVRNLGYVAGTASLPRNRMRSTFRSLGLLIGVAQSQVAGDPEQLRNAALESVRKRAEALGANAVIGVHFDVWEAPDGEAAVTVRGRAVVLAPNGAVH
jgi:uncharacterized protein YbjQ (UPF0145 family)